MRWWWMGLVLLTGCSRELEQTYAEGTYMVVGDASEEAGGMLTLGPPLPNPYLVEHMKAAADSLRRKGLDLPDVVRQTHRYIRVRPTNADAYEALVADTSIAWYDHPLDREPERGGRYYHDPALPDSLPTPQYACIPVQRPLPEGAELLAGLYLPEDDVLLQEEERERLVDAAFHLAGMPEAGDAEASRFRPGGRITIWDTRLGACIGLEGAEVRARRWFRTLKARTDVHGYYRMPGRFHRSCHYSLLFATPLFAVREHFFGLTSWIQGPKTSTDWTHEVSDGYHRFVGHVFRAAWRYHHGDNAGLRRPAGVLSRIIYAARNAALAHPASNGLVWPLIRIGRYETPGSEWDSDEIYSTTLHETAHMSHFRMGAGMFWGVGRTIRESWAVGVEWALTAREYRMRGLLNYGGHDYHPGTGLSYPACCGFQWWTPWIDDTYEDYTPLFIDLVDDFNQQRHPFPHGGVGLAGDRVGGYTLQVLEDRVIRHLSGADGLGGRLKANKPPGVSEADIDALLAVYL